MPPAALVLYHKFLKNEDSLRTKFSTGTLGTYQYMYMMWCTLAYRRIWYPGTGTLPVLKFSRSPVVDYHIDQNVDI